MLQHFSQWTVVLLRHAERIKRQMSWIICYERAVLKNTWNSRTLAAEFLTTPFLRTYPSSFSVCVSISSFFSCISSPTTSFQLHNYSFSSSALLFFPICLLCFIFRVRMLENSQRAASDVCSRAQLWRSTINWMTSERQYQYVNGR